MPFTERIRKFFASNLGRDILEPLRVLYTVLSVGVFTGIFLSLVSTDPIKSFERLSASTSPIVVIILFLLTLPGLYLSSNPAERRRRKLGDPETYSEKLTRLIENLTKASAEVDLILKELSLISIERASTVELLEMKLRRLTQHEAYTKKRIQDLESLPISVAEHFAKLTESGEKRGARRDYMLFIAGLIAGQLLQIVLKAFGY